MNKIFVDIEVTGGIWWLTDGTLMFAPATADGRVDVENDQQQVENLDEAAVYALQILNK